MRSIHQLRMQPLLLADLRRSSSESTVWRELIKTISLCGAKVLTMGMLQPTVKNTVLSLWFCKGVTQLQTFALTGDSSIHISHCRTSRVMGWTRFPRAVRLPETFALELS